eukprot:scaffold86139_cov59-Phaeocystis_antarctica.AAC.6
MSETRAPHSCWPNSAAQRISISVAARFQTPAPPHSRRRSRPTRACTRSGCGTTQWARRELRRSIYVDNKSPIWPASAAQEADRPRLAAPRRRSGSLALVTPAQSGQTLVRALVAT